MLITEYTKDQWLICNNINKKNESNKELQVLTNRLVESSKAHGIEINHEKSKTMVNSKNIQKANIYLEEYHSETFEYLGATLKVDGSSDNELRIRISTAYSAMIQLNIIWTSKTQALK